MPKYEFKAASVRRIDSALTITDILSEPQAAFDLVIADLDGAHGLHVNHVSDRAYFILSGTAKVTVSDDSFAVGPFDVIYIPRDTPHGINGCCRFAIITSPPFLPKNEDTVG